VTAWRTSQAQALHASVGRGSTAAARAEDVKKGGVAHEDGSGQVSPTQCKPPSRETAHAAASSGEAQRQREQETRKRAAERAISMSLAQAAIAAVWQGQLARAVASGGREGAGVHCRAK
jgi:hypothetical protein